MNNILYIRRMKKLFDIKQFSKKSGIYKIQINKKFYIGSSINLHNRFKQHKTSLNKNKSKNIHLQYSFNKYGKENVYYEILYEFINQPKTVELLTKEKYYIDLLKPKFNFKLDPLTQNNTLKNSKKIYRYSLEGYYIDSFVSIAEAERQLGFLIKDHNVKSKEKSSNGYMFRLYYKKKIKPYSNNTGQTNKKKITSYSLLGKKLKTYNSITECCKDLYPYREFFQIFDLISSCAEEKLTSVENYRFSYIDNNRLSNERLYKLQRGSIPLLQFSLDKKLIKVWRNITECIKYYNFTEGFRYHLNKNGLVLYKNFYWERMGSQSDELLEYLESQLTTK